MTSVSATTLKTPSTTDTIMASALLDFSRNNTGGNDSAKSSDAESSVLLADIEGKTTQSKPSKALKKTAFELIWRSSLII